MEISYLLLLLAIFALSFKESNECTSSSSSNPPNGLVSVINYGAFTARFIVSFSLAGFNEVDTSDTFVSNQRRSMVIPGANNWRNLYSGSMNSYEQACFVTRGTIFSPSIQFC